MQTVSKTVLFFIDMIGDEHEFSIITTHTQKKVEKKEFSLVFFSSSFLYIPVDFQFQTIT